MNLDATDGPPGGPTSLDPQETSPCPFSEEHDPEWHPLDLQSRHQEIAHRHHQGTRRRVLDAMWKSTQEHHRKRATRLGSCCACPVWHENTAGALVPALRRCRDRLCPLCAKRRGTQAATKCHALIQLFDAPRLVTLTQLSKHEPLADSIRRILASLDALRKHKFWTGRVRGGVWALEITRNALSGHWHAHVHLVVDSEFIPQAALKSVWHEITGDSFVVDVRAVHDRREAARYVAQYVAKPLDVHRWPPESILEFSDALHGRRMLQPFGVALKTDVDADDNEEPPPDCTEIGPASQLLDAAKYGSTAARHAREILARVGGDFEIAVCWPRDRGAAPPAVVETWELDYARRVLRLCSIIDVRMSHAIDAKAGLPGVEPQPPPPAPVHAPRLW